MGLTVLDGRSYGDVQGDIRAELRRFASGNGDDYVPVHFADAVCTCGRHEFLLLLDDGAGVAARVCATCGDDHVMADGEDFLDDAELEDTECLCGSPVFEITIGVSLYRDSEDVKWLYVGCRCPACGLVGAYGDWKNEFGHYAELLKRV